MLKTITTTLLLTTLVVSLAGCNSREKQQEEHDAKLRQEVERLKHKSNAYPVNGSHTWTHYLP